MRRLRQLRRWVGTFTPFDWAWLAWLGAFLCIEGAALRDAKSGGTFSEAWWWFAGIRDRRNRYAWITRGLAFGFSCWLAVHLWSRKV